MNPRKAFYPDVDGGQVLVKIEKSVEEYKFLNAVANEKSRESL